MSLRCLALCAVFACLAASAQTTGCNANNASPSLTISLPDHPFGVAVTADGCTVFASLGPGGKIAVLKRSDGQISLTRTLTTKAQSALGMVLTKDGKTLVVAARDRVVFLDVQRAISGAGNAILGSFSDGRNAGSVEANLTPDEKLLFVSDELQRGITVVDFARARTNGFHESSMTGSIPTGASPIALLFSQDGKWLYTTTQAAPPAWNWPKACKPERAQVPNPPLVNSEGAVVVVDVAKAATDPAGSVAARIPAGCSPVRLALSPDGNRLYATARNQNAVLAFDTSKFLTDAAHARLGTATVGESPVPIAVVKNGSRIVVGNSNRFGHAGETSELMVLDAARIEGNDASAQLGTMPSGSFPREMAITSDGKTLLLTNYNSKSLQAIDLTRLPY
jgi:DNA-binding beta-propeller fold protein YncE